MAKTNYVSVEQGCQKCMVLTPHDLYSKCLQCGTTNQEKYSPADRERDRDAVKRQTKKLLDDWGYGL